MGETNDDDLSALLCAEHRKGYGLGVDKDPEVAAYCEGLLVQAQNKGAKMHKANWRALAGLCSKRFGDRAPIYWGSYRKWARRRGLA